MVQSDKEIIKQKFSILCDMVSDTERTIISSLQTELERRGEQSVRLYDGSDAVPLYYINDENDPNVMYVDKVGIGSEGNVEIHEAFDDDMWRSIDCLDTTSLLTLIKCIDWN